MAEKAPPKKRWLLEFTSSNSNPCAGSSAGGGGGGGGGGRDGAASPALKAAKATPEKKRVRIKLPGNPSAGGGGGEGAAAAAPAPRQRPSSSRPRSRSRSPSPPKPFTYNPGVESSGVPRWEPKSSHFPSPLSPPSSDDKASDAEEPGEVKRRNGWGSLFMSDPQVLSMYSSDPQNLPHHIGRQDHQPLSTQLFFSLRHNWQRLLRGKRTYLRPPKNKRVVHNDDDHVFVTPEPPAMAIEVQRPLSFLVCASEERPTIQQKLKILSEHYLYFRPMHTDGSQFYRAFLFSYLENLGKMQCSKAEVTRLMECVERSRENFHHLQWNNAYFSNPEAFFSSVVYEFEELVNSVVNGLNADELYKRSLQEISSSRILCLLRLLTEVHIRTHEADLKRVLGQKDALLFCIEHVRPFGADIEVIQISALSEALGIPVHVAVVNSDMKDGPVQVWCLDFVPRSESGVSRTSGPLSLIRDYYLSSATDKHPGVSRTSGPLSSIREYYLSSATDKHPVLPAGTLFLSDRMPLVTILMTTTGSCILYRK